MSQLRYSRHYHSYNSKRRYPRSRENSIYRDNYYHRTDTRYRDNISRSRSRSYNKYKQHNNRNLYNNYKYRYDNARKQSYRSKKKSNESDDIIHFEWSRGMELSNKYIVKSKMGDGTFGRVLRCKDKETDNNLAIKVVRDVEKYTNSAKIEAGILFDIKKADPEGNSKCVILHDSFYHGPHLCLVFEALGLSLYDFLKRNDYMGFFMRDIQDITRQALQSLSFLKKIKLIHTDLKPENILFTCHPDDYDICKNPRSSNSRLLTKRPSSSSVKIIDFGSATYSDDYHTPLINTRQYRAPEVILDTGWSYASDMWSLGCILIELYTGKLLFNTHDHLEHLAMMEYILGRFPSNLLSDARKTSGSKYLNRDGTSLNWPDGAKSSSSIRRVEDCHKVHDLILHRHKLFADFIVYILQPDQYIRPDPDEALRHPFITTTMPE